MPPGVRPDPDSPGSPATPAQALPDCPSSHLCRAPGPKRSPSGLAQTVPGPAQTTPFTGLGPEDFFSKAGVAVRPQAVVEVARPVRVRPPVPVVGRAQHGHYPGELIFAAEKERGPGPSRAAAADGVSVEERTGVDSAVRKGASDVRTREPPAWTQPHLTRTRLGPATSESARRR